MYVVAALKPTLNKTLQICKITQFSTCNMTKKALVLIAPGSEEMECIISVDVLRRAGVEVTLAGVSSSEPVKCSRDVVIVPDIALADAGNKAPYDVVVLPGGLGGSKVFCECKELGLLLKQQESEGRLIAAICAAPTALRAHSVGFGKNITSYPSVEAQVTEGGKYTYKQDNVVVDGNLITSRGPGTAFQFALSLVEQLIGKEKAEQVAKGMLMSH